MDCVVSLRNKENETPQIVCAGNLGQSPQCKPCRSCGTFGTFALVRSSTLQRPSDPGVSDLLEYSSASWLIEHAVNIIQVPVKDLWRTFKVGIC